MNPFLLGFEDELAKMAKKKDEKPSKAAALGLAGGALVGTPLASVALMAKLHGEDLTPKEMRRLKKTIKPGMPMFRPKGKVSKSFVMHPAHKKWLKHPVYRGYREGLVEAAMMKQFPEQLSTAPVGRRAHGGVILVPRGRGAGGVAAHEMGHARIHKGRFGRPLRAAKMVGGLTGAGALWASILADPESGIAKAAPIAAGIGMAPMLADEAIASLSAIKGMKKAKVPKAKIRAARLTLAKAFGTYGLAAGAVTALPYAIRKIKQAFGKKNLFMPSGGSSRPSARRKEQGNERSVS